MLESEADMAADLGARDCLIHGVRGSGLIRGEMAVADTTEMLDDEIIDPVT